MTPPDIFRVLHKYHSELANNTLTYKAVKGTSDAIEGTTVAGTHYIFSFKNTKEWSLYYGKATKNFERR